MRKKKFFSMLLVVSILGSTTFLGSEKIFDPVLENATQITKKIFYDSFEEKKSKKYGSFSSFYLMGGDGEKDYVLSTCATGGYAIFEKESMELLEYSDIGRSPYKNRLKENYYLGLNNYYEGDGEKLKNINTGKSFPKEKISVLANKLKEKLKDDREDRKEELQKEQKKLKKFSKEKVASDPGPTGEDTIDANSYVVNARKYIPNYQFFVGNEQFGDNQNGTCSSVAAQLLLAYNNWANDGRIIPDEPKYANEKFFLEGRENYRDKPYSNEMMGTTSSDFKDDNEKSFYEVLKGYINPLDWADDEQEPANADEIEVGATMLDIYSGINQYLAEYAPEAKKNITMSCSLTDNHEWNNAREKLRKEIDEGRPSIGSIYVYHLKEDETYEVKGHAVVVYGTQNIIYKGQSLDGFIANFGWIDSAATHVWFNSSWLKGYLTFKTTHIHNNEILLDSYNHVFQCEECSASVIKNAHIPTNDFKLLSKDDEDFDNSHLNLCVCGYAIKQYHSFSYTPQNHQRKHDITCVCGYRNEQSHFYKSGSDFCWYCGARENY